MIVLDCKYYISREWWRSKRCAVLAGGGRASLFIAVVKDGANVQRLRPSLRRLCGRDRGATSDAPHAPGIGEVSRGRSPQVIRPPSTVDVLAWLIPWICGRHQSGTGNRWAAAFPPPGTLQARFAAACPHPIAFLSVSLAGTGAHDRAAGSLPNGIARC